MEGLRVISRQAVLEKNAALTTNAWHHVAVVYDGRTRIIYLDGEVLIADPATPAKEDFADKLNLALPPTMGNCLCPSRKLPH